MRRALAVFALAFPIAAAAQEETTTLRVGGSTTLLPAIATAASDFMEKHGTWDKVDPKLPAKPVVVFVTGGGSSFGVKSAANGAVDIGLVSRELKDTEKALLGEHQVYLVGKDCVAVAVNKKNPLAARAGFAASDLARVFAGEVKTYKDLDAALPAKPFVLLVRDAGAGAAEIFKDKIMAKKDVSADALQLPSQGALLKKLEGNAQAIAYISSGVAAQSEELKTFAIDGKEPTAANIRSGDYPLVRPLYLLVKGKPSPAAQRFVDYVLAEGQRRVAEQGFEPVADPVALAAR
jgi:phosphate transport system substrate-binding protein